MAEEKILKKTPAAKKPRKPKTTTHPPYFQMIKEALMALKEKNGSSPYAIAKKIEEKHKSLLPESFRKILSLQLKNSVTKGKLVKIRASYKLSDTTKMTTRLQDKKSKKNMKQEDKEITKRTRSSSTRSKKSMSVNKQEKMRKAKKARQPKSIKSSAGERAVSNSFDMSLLEINANYPAVLEFVANLPPDVMPLTIEDSKAKQVNAEQRKKDYYDRFPRKTISGLFCFSETGKCNIICTIMNIDTDYSWYFFSCLKCSKTAYKIPKVENEIVKKGKKEMFWCPTCKEDTPKVIPRYLLNVGVMDNTGDTKCLIFDKSAQEIIGVSAEDLLEGKWDEVSTVWLGNESDNLDTVEDSDQQTDQRNDLSIDQEGLALTNSSETTDPLGPTSSTPSSKRSMDAVSEDIEGQGSTTKKACVSSILGDIEKEEIEGGKN
ncbi:unnamed protein product [Arabidopsis arenosa]|uniref:H15 domain-containing protein n=1 Tax=Arabidopsis arenosa TaxID=38785 RepID=A0A8S2A3S2_ARAAE|nr:unnamed protein product [Arabidopsis arenosa]